MERPALASASPWAERHRGCPVANRQPGSSDRSRTTGPPLPCRQRRRSLEAERSLDNDTWFNDRSRHVDWLRDYYGLHDCNRRRFARRTFALSLLLIVPVFLV